jgi:uncharacterized protein YifE (UPF0438 family)
VAHPGLTSEENDLINRHLRFYEALAKGLRKPTTEAQRHFVEVTGGRATVSTAHELAYIKYCRLRARHRDVPDEQDRYSSIPEYEDGTPSDGWYSRDDHWKLRRNQYADMKRRGRG